MKWLALVAPILAAGLSTGYAADAGAPLAVVERLFAAMSAHDAAAASALFLPEASLFSVRQDGAASATPYRRWVDRMGAAKDAWLERIWEPKQFEHGTVALVWAEFDFHLNGKFSHCGVDAFTLLRTSSGWKIAAVADTHETTTCTPSPLGPPGKTDRSPAPPRAQAAPMTTRETIDRFNDAFNRHDADALAALLTEDTVFEDTSPSPDGARYEGKAAVVDYWRKWFARNPDAKFDAEEMIVFGDRAVVRWIYRKMRNGQPWHIRGVDVFTVRDGKVAAKLAYVKG